MHYLLLSVTEFIGRFHPVLVHLPIGVLLLALLLQWLSSRPGYIISFAVMKLVWWIGIAGALLSCITGYLLSLKGDYAEDLVNRHMWSGIAVACISLFVASLVFKRDHGLLYKVGSVTLLLLVLLTGHFGGSLTHGSDYLLSGWNEADEAALPEQVKLITNVQEANVYSDVVEPILAAKCYSCHGEKKQKGKLRLDNPGNILKGGKDGKVLVSGEPAESELLKRILLPETEDDHMPPKQKSQLKEGQVNLIRWWIQEGCSFDKKVNQLQQPDKIKTLLASLEHKKTGESESLNLIPGQPVEAADPKAINKLKAKGVVVIPVSSGSNYLLVNFITANNFTDADMKLLLPLDKQVVSLKAGNSRITDESLKIIGGLKNLAVLQLNNTVITDKGVVHLNKLQNLQSLNLVNTKVSAIGVRALDQLAKLRHVYLYMSAVDATGYQQLKQAFPKTQIDTGGYTLPYIPSDTQYLTRPKKVDG